MALEAKSLQFRTKMPLAQRPRHTFCNAWAHLGVSDVITAYCPTPERVEGIREEMTQFLKWTPEGLMILGTASDGEYRTEITTEARESHEPTSSRLRNAQK